MKETEVIVEKDNEEEGNHEGPRIDIKNIDTSEEEKVNIPQLNNNKRAK